MQGGCRGTLISGCSLRVTSAGVSKHSLAGRRLLRMEWLAGTVLMQIDRHLHSPPVSIHGLWACLLLLPGNLFVASSLPYPGFGKLGLLFL